MTSNQFELRSTEKTAVFAEVENYLKDLKLTVINKDMKRPWGGFFVLDETQAEQFRALFFP